MRPQSKTKKTTESAGKRTRSIRDWFKFYMWLVERLAWGPITEQSKAKPMQSRVTFDFQLKIALNKIVQNTPRYQQV